MIGDRLVGHSQQIGVRILYGSKGFPRQFGWRHRNFDTARFRFGYRASDIGTVKNYGRLALRPIGHEIPRIYDEARFGAGRGDFDPLSVRAHMHPATNLESQYIHLEI